MLSELLGPIGDEACARIKKAIPGAQNIRFVFEYDSPDGRVHTYSNFSREQMDYFVERQEAQ